MFPRFRFLTALLGLAALLSGCGSLGSNWPFGKKKPLRAIAKFAQFVGTVTLVSEEPSFVLIDNGSTPPPAAGTVLAINYQGGAPVMLKVTPIRKPPFVVADIVKGTPRKGDQVFQ